MRDWNEPGRNLGARTAAGAGKRAGARRPPSSQPLTLHNTGVIIRAGVKAVLSLIVISVIATLVAIGAYQLLLQKYYWGPKGPPKKEAQKKDKDPLGK
jgi:hypothetical protein